MKSYVSKNVYDGIRIATPEEDKRRHERIKKIMARFPKTMASLAETDK